MDKYIGRLLDNRYEILEIIGTGGMAVVYKARCHRLNRLVAIKILKDDFLEDEEFRNRFHSESQAVAMLSHPNIVSIYDVSTSITADYIVMELIDGITLKQYMEKKGVLNWKETLHFAIQIAKALEHAHSRGIVHRDIKPHNVMVLKNGSVKVTDFGIARMMSKGSTLTKEALGSVHYISPEQAKGGRVDNRSDIYSLGVVMYEMMSGRPPYDGDSPVAVAIKHINGGAVMPSTMNPNIPGGLEQIIMKAMAKEAGERYNTATKMLADMDEFRKNPAILFDYNTPPLDEVTKIGRTPLVLEVPEKQPTTAERVARSEKNGKTAGNSGNKRPAGGNRESPPARRNREQSERKKNNAATIAVIACSLVIVAAIVVFLVVLLNGGTGGKPQLVTVPPLVGKLYQNLPEYADFDIKKDKEVHDNNYKVGEIIEQTPAAGEKIAKGETVYVVVSLGEAKASVTMPDLVDWEEAQARRNLDNLNLNLQIEVLPEYHDTIASGSVIRTEPEKEAELEVGQKVVLYVSQGVEIKSGAMPNVVGDKKESAVKVLDSQSLELEYVFEEIFDSAVPVGDVVRTEPEMGETLRTGQKITLYISKGPELAEIKKVVGLSVDSAVSVLKADGFVNYEIEPIESDKAKDTVVEMRVGSQVVEAGEKLDVKSKITLYVSSGPAQITKDVVIDLRGSTGAGECKVSVTRDGTLVFKQTIAQGVTSVTIPDQVGYGTVYYKVVIGDADGWIEEVVFDAEQ